MVYGYSHIEFTPSLPIRMKPERENGFFKIESTFGDFRLARRDSWILTLIGDTHSCDHVLRFLLELWTMPANLYWRHSL